MADEFDGKPDDVLEEALEDFSKAADCENLNRLAYVDDVNFALLDQQWPQDVRQQREIDGRPCLTVNKLRPIIKQVGNDARQNTPAIVVHPADSGADVETAQIINGLIRNIEACSDADTAYDTALECAVSGGFGYFRIGLEYSSDDTFDKDIVIQTIPNPLSVYGDPHSTAMDSADWNTAFVVDRMSKSAFEKRFKGAEAVDWSTEYSGVQAPWYDEDQVQVAEYWRRDQILRPIVALSNGQVVGLDVYEQQKDAFDAAGVSVVGSPRDVRSHKVTQYLMTGAEVLETTAWVGKFIPIIPVYGEVVNLEGIRWFRSLIRSAKDAQQMFNFWRTAETELVALAPKAPFIGPKGAFESDQEKWATANTDTYAYIEYDGAIAPARQPFAGPPAGALQAALNASDDIKSSTGIYDASLGARSNETSGRAIMARQREGDVSTFNFIDNLSRAIRHAGRVTIDLIPHVYNGARVIRVLGPDPSQPPMNVQLGKPTPVVKFNRQPEEGPGHEQAEELRIYDLTLGKYDLTVRAGPSYTSQREEAASQMIELIRVFPAAAPVIGDLLATNLDWPGAEQIAERLRALLPPAAKGDAGIPPELQQQIQQGTQLIQQLQQQLSEAKAKEADNTAEYALKQQELDIKAYEAETDRMEAEAKAADAKAQMIRAQSDAQAQQDQIALVASQVISHLEGRMAA